MRPYYRPYKGQDANEVNCLQSPRSKSPSHGNFNNGHWCRPGRFCLMVLQHRTQPGNFRNATVLDGKFYLSSPNSPPPGSLETGRKCRPKRFSSTSPSPCMVKAKAIREITESKIKWNDCQMVPSGICFSRLCRKWFQTFARTCLQASVFLKRQPRFSTPQYKKKLRN